MTWKPYLQLVRLPNVFTAAADSLAGSLLVAGSLAGPGVWLPLTLASACIYAGGIALNDVLDVEIDRRERPGRPIPSGRVSLASARTIALGLLLMGLGLACVASTRWGWLVAAGLIACVIVYDFTGKATALGPQVMGACRALNFLLGMTAAARLGGPAGWVAAGSYGLFVAGVTWISRSEVETGRWKTVAVGAALQNMALVGFVGVALAARAFPSPLPAGSPWVLAGVGVLVGVGGLVASRTVKAIAQPGPETIQRAVKLSILSLVWLHVGLVLAVRGPVAAAAVALFMVPGGGRGAVDLFDVEEALAMKLGYNTNGLAHHRMRDAIPFLAAEGYQSVALTLDVGHLDPYDDPKTLEHQVAETVQLLDRHHMARVVETGARYLLNPTRKHDPTLLDPDPARRTVRVDFLRRSIDLANRLGAPVVSIWSGVLPDDAPEDVALQRLAEGLRETLRHAEGRGVTVAFEPEPGMFIDTLAAYARLEERVRHPLLQLTVDIGHVHCLEDGPVSAHLSAWGPRIVNVHLEDMRRGVHDHLMFGAGTIDFADVFTGLRAIGYDGGLHVELSRHSHAAVEAVRGSAAFLRPFLDDRDR